MSINLHIKRLVIGDIGIDPQRLDEVNSATRSELEKQIRALGLGSNLQSHHANKRLDGGQIPGGNNLNPVKTGQQIGRAVFRGIRK
jgi:hypothetical protein